MVYRYRCTKCGTPETQDVDVEPDVVWHRCPKARARHLVPLKPVR